MSPTRFNSSLPNEQLSVETLGSYNLLDLSATVSGPEFTFTDPTNHPYQYTTTTAVTRDQIQQVASISNSGAVTLQGADTSVSYSGANILRSGDIGSGLLNLRSRNPKAKDTGPSIVLEGASSNCEENTSSSTSTPYAAIKATPISSIVSNDVDTNTGGQLVFLTTPLGESTPHEALRINEAQQVCIGLTTTASSRTTSSKGETLYVSGVSYLDGDVYTTGGLAVGTTSLTEGIDLTVANSISVGSTLYVGTSFAASSSGLNISSGICTAADGFSGTLLTPDQPNITGVGTLTSLNADTASITGDAFIEGLLTVGSLSIASIDAPSAQFEGICTAIQGFSGRLLTASQPNITGVGTLSSLSVSGICTASSGLSGTLLTASQPNITNVGTLSSLSVSGICTASSGLSGTLLTANQPNITGLGTVASFRATNADVSGTLGVTTAVISSLATLSGDIVFGDLSSWKPTSGSTYSLPNSSATRADGGKGYYELPGGLCIQWGVSTDASTNSWYYPKTLSYVYGVWIQRADYFGGTGGSGGCAVLVSVTSTHITFDSVYGDTNKADCMVLVIGKV